MCRAVTARQVKSGSIRLVTVVLRLVWAFDRYVNVIGLCLAQRCELGANFIQVKTGDFFVQLLGQDVYLVLVFITLGEEFDLRHDLVGE